MSRHAVKDRCIDAGSCRRRPWLGQWGVGALRPTALSSAALLRLARESVAFGFDRQLVPDAILDRVAADAIHLAVIAERYAHAWNPEIPLHHRILLDIEVIEGPSSIGEADVLVDTWDQLADQ